MIHWTKTLKVNVQTLDEQHKALMESIARLEHLLSQKSGRADIDGVLNELAQQTQRHFETEERLMAQYDYPRRHAHAQLAHVLLLEDLNKLCRNFHSGTLQVDAQTLEFLMAWLVDHIDIDRDLGAFLNSKGVR